MLSSALKIPVPVFRFANNLAMVQKVQGILRIKCAKNVSDRLAFPLILFKNLFFNKQWHQFFGNDAVFIRVCNEIIANNLIYSTNQMCIFFIHDNSQQVISSLTKLINLTSNHENLKTC